MKSEEVSRQLEGRCTWVRGTGHHRAFGPDYVSGCFTTWEINGCRVLMMLK